MEIWGMSLGGFHFRWLMNVVILPAILILIAIFAKVIVDRKINLQSDAKAHIDLRGALFMIIFFVYPPMMSNSMTTWLCTPLDGPSGDRTLLDADDQVFCEDTQHKVYQLMSLVGAS